jgi:hypothetical protein
LKLKFGTWEIEWGTINRFQRPNGDINLQYNEVYPLHLDQRYSGLPAYKAIKTVVKNAGSNGNSFVCAVEFGPK